MSYIDENEGEVMTLMQDNEKLELIRKSFSTSQLDMMNDKIFSEATGISYKTIRSWRERPREHKGNLHQNTKSKISSAFNLKYEVWEDEIAAYHEDIFFQKLQNQYREIIAVPDQGGEKLDEFMLGSTDQISVEEEDMLAFFKQDEVITLPGNIETYSPEFMLSLAQQLKSKNQINDALKVLDALEGDTQSFKYTYQKKISHLRSILLSHRNIQKWDEAIDILRYLYAGGYHLEDPEIVTLMASNHKRKALYHPNGTLNYPDQVDLERLANAMTLYHEAYRLKQPEEKYYDAINIAYLKVILDVLGEGESGINVHKEIEKLYGEVYGKEWEVDPSDWWQVASRMEFELLLGRDGEAEMWYRSLARPPEQFEVDATIRQLELCSHFAPDTYAGHFLSFLRTESTIR